MNQTRRYAMKQILFVSAGAMLVPACMEDKSKASFLVKNFKIDADQENMLAEVSETIIPATDTPGAKDISAHLFSLKMLDDCYKKEDQQKFVKGMEQFQKNCKSEYDKSFADCTAQQKASILKDMEMKKNQDNELAFFYNTIKQLTIQAYTTSKF